jgi:hypothetical protein
VQDSTNDKKYDLNVDGNNFSIDDMSAGASRFTIKDGGNVGIGTTNPANKLQITTSGAGSPYIGFNQVADNPYMEAQRWSGVASTYYGTRLKNLTGDFVFETTDLANIGSQTFTEKMRLKANGNVGIGTSSPFPSARLQVNTGTNLNLAVQTGTTLTNGMKINAFNNAGNANIPLELNGSVMLLKTGETERMRIDSSGNVGIGTSSPTEKLDINGGTVIKGSLTNSSGTGSALRMQHSSNISEILSLEPGVAWRELRLNAAQHTFYIAGGERMRIDSSGNVLVNKTASGSLGTAGFEFASNNTLRATKGSSAPAEFNRLTNDGDIALFYKDTSIVGSIGNISTRMYIGSGDTGIFFDSVRNQIQPTNPSTGSNIDAAIDLGRDVFRFKDIYLSGGIQFDSRANKLDDYEEGTFDPVVENGTYTYSYRRGHYTKIGNIVHIHIGFKLNAASPGSSVGTISGLPFTSMTYGGYREPHARIGAGGLFVTAITTQVYTQERHQPIVIHLLTLIQYGKQEHL